MFDRIFRYFKMAYIPSPSPARHFNDFIVHLGETFPEIPELSHGNCLPNKIRFILGLLSPISAFYFDFCHFIYNSLSKLKSLARFSIGSGIRTRPDCTCTSMNLIVSLPLPCPAALKNP